jgi:hypothetical protein
LQRHREHISFSFKKTSWLILFRITVVVYSEIVWNAMCKNAEFLDVTAVVHTPVVTSIFWMVERNEISRGPGIWKKKKGNEAHYMFDKQPVKPTLRWIFLFVMWRRVGCSADIYVHLGGTECLHVLSNLCSLIMLVYCNYLATFWTRNVRFPTGMDFFTMP